MVASLACVEEVAGLEGRGVVAAAGGEQGLTCGRRYPSVTICALKSVRCRLTGWERAVDRVQVSMRIYGASDRVRMQNSWPLLIRWRVLKGDVKSMRLIQK